MTPSRQSCPLVHHKYRSLPTDSGLWDVGYVVLLMFVHGITHQATRNVFVPPTKFAANDHCRYILQCVWAYGIRSELKWHLLMVGVARGPRARHYGASIKYSLLRTSKIL